MLYVKIGPITFKIKEGNSFVKCPECGKLYPVPPQLLGAAPEPCDRCKGKYSAAKIALEFLAKHCAAHPRCEGCSLTTGNATCGAVCPWYGYRERSNQPHENL